MNTEAALIQDPLPQEAFACEISGRCNINKSSTVTELYTQYLQKNEQDPLDKLLTYLVPGVRFNLRELEFSVIWIHALNFFSGWRTQHLI